MTIGIYLFESLGMAAGLFYGWLKLFEKLEPYAGSELKTVIVTWMRSKDGKSTQAAGLTTQSLRLFDSIFGKDHLTWRCFGFSAAVSMTTFLLFYFVFILWKGWSIGMPASFFKEMLNPGLLLGLILVSALLNCIPDYISLLETRWLLGLLEKNSESLTWIAITLIMDLLITSAIFLIMPAAVVVVMEGVNPFSTSSIKIITGMLAINAQHGRTFAPLYIAYATTFATSIWLLLYFIGAGLVRLGVGYSLFLRYVAIDERPIGSIGLLGGLVVALLYLLGYSIYTIQSLV